MAFLPSFLLSFQIPLLPSRRDETTYVEADRFRGQRRATWVGRLKPASVCLSTYSPSQLNEKNMDQQWPFSRE